MLEKLHSITSKHLFILCLILVLTNKVGWNFIKEIYKFIIYFKINKIFKLICHYLWIQLITTHFANVVARDKDLI